MAASTRCAKGRRTSGRRLLIFGFLLQVMLETTLCYSRTLPFRYTLNTISSDFFEHCPLAYPLSAVAGIGLSILTEEISLSLSLCFCSSIFKYTSPLLASALCCLFCAVPCDLRLDPATISMAHVDQSPVFFLLSRKRSILAVAEDSSLVWLQNIAKKVPLNLSHQARGCRRLQKILVQNIFYAHQVEPMWFHQYGELILKVEGSASICGQKLFLSGVRAVSCITEGCSSSLMTSSFLQLSAGLLTIALQAITFRFNMSEQRACTLHFCPAAISKSLLRQRSLLQTLYL